MLYGDLNRKEIQKRGDICIVVNSKGNQPCIFVGRADAEVKDPILWPPDSKSRLTGKDPDAGKDRGQEEKGVGRG